MAVFKKKPTTYEELQVVEATTKTDVEDFVFPSKTVDQWVPVPDQSQTYIGISDESGHLVDEFVAYGTYLRAEITPEGSFAAIDLTSEALADDSSMMETVS